MIMLCELFFIYVWYTNIYLTTYYLYQANTTLGKKKEKDFLSLKLLRYQQ